MRDVAVMGGRTWQRLASSSVKRVSQYQRHSFLRSYQGEVKMNIFSQCGCFLFYVSCIFSLFCCVLFFRSLIRSTSKQLGCPIISMIATFSWVHGSYSHIHLYTPTYMLTHTHTHSKWKSHIFYQLIIKLFKKS